MTSRLNQAVELRSTGKAEEALVVLLELLADSPEDPQLNYQTAWTCDVLGRETDAVPYYRQALDGGLAGEELRGALLGLGSTYRCLGKYDASIAVLDRAVAEFPEDRALRAFRALTLHNLGRSDEAVTELLTQLLDTTESAELRAYEGALRFYSTRLDEVFE